METYPKDLIMWKEKIKQAWDDNPLMVISIVGLVALSAAKLIDAVSSAQSRHAYSKQIDYRVKHGR
jgi:hypothetical protein